MCAICVKHHRNLLVSRLKSFITKRSHSPVSARLPTHAPINPPTHPPTHPLNPARYRSIIDNIRRYMPDASISGDVIVGFPGEPRCRPLHLGAAQLYIIA